MSYNIYYQYFLFYFHQTRFLLPLHPPSPSHPATVIAELFHYSPIYILMILNSYCCHNIGAICKNYCYESFIMQTHWHTGIRADLISIQFDYQNAGQNISNSQVPAQKYHGTRIYPKLLKFFCLLRMSIIDILWTCLYKS